MRCILLSLVCLCVHILTLIRLANMRVAAFLRALMFVYDNFWGFLSVYILSHSRLLTARSPATLPARGLDPRSCGCCFLLPLFGAFPTELRPLTSPALMGC